MNRRHLLEQLAFELRAPDPDLHLDLAFSVGEQPRRLLQLAAVPTLLRTIGGRDGLTITFHAQTEDGVGRIAQAASTALGYLVDVTTGGVDPRRLGHCSVSYDAGTWTVRETELLGVETAANAIVGHLLGHEPELYDFTASTPL